MAASHSPLKLERRLDSALETAKKVPFTKIRKRADFLAANRGKRFVTSGFILLVNDRKDSDQTARFGITVTKKIGNAVVRNRMKRRFRALWHELPADSGISGSDHILIGRAGGVERDIDLLRDDLKRGLRKLSK